VWYIKGRVFIQIDFNKIDLNESKGAVQCLLDERKNYRALKKSMQRKALE
jgi:hypothetical protein